MKKGFIKDELYKMGAVEIYKLVLEKKYLKTFPNGFWQNQESINNAIKCTKYLIEDILKLSEEDLKKQLSSNLFREHGLAGMLSICFNGSPYEAINKVYPNKYQPWEFNQVSIGYWGSIENGILATKWLIETKLKLSEKELKKQLSAKLFKENGLRGMLQYCFNNSPYEAINATYPHRFQPWEFNIVPKGYWNDVNNGVKATKWLIETKLKLSEEELKQKLSISLFKKNGLSCMLENCFNSSPYDAINTSYPEKNYQPWEFKQVPQGYWDNIDNGIKCTKWLIETKLQLSERELKEQLSTKLFRKHGLCGMLSSCFNDSPYEAINKTYPNKFQPWEFNVVPIGYWNNIDNGVLATKWLIENKLQLNEEQLKQQLSAKLFRKNGLGGMLQHCFDGSPYEAINKTYPNKFKKSDFKNCNYYKYKNKTY